MAVFSSCTDLTIYAEVESKPIDWYSYWNYSNRPVVWGCTLAAENGYSYVVSFTKSASSISNQSAENVITAPYREGYTFGGWATTSNSIIAAYTAADIFNAPDGTTLYAIWIENEED